MPSSELTYPTWGPGEKENHLQKCLGRGYVSSQEGNPLLEKIKSHFWLGMYLLQRGWFNHQKALPKQCQTDIYTKHIRKNTQNTATNTWPLKVLCVSFDPRANDLLAASCLSGQILFWNVVTAQTVTWWCLFFSPKFGDCLVKFCVFLLVYVYISNNSDYI